MGSGREAPQDRGDLLRLVGRLEGTRATRPHHTAVGAALPRCCAAFPRGEEQGMAELLAERIVATLRQEGPLTVPELAERLGVPGPLVGGALEHLHAREAVTKVGGRLAPYAHGGGQRWLSLWAVGPLADG